MSSEAAAAATPIRLRKAHRAGPVEDELGRKTQRCLRCDVLLNIVHDQTPELKVGRRVYLKKLCPGTLDWDVQVLTPDGDAEH